MARLRWSLAGQRDLIGIGEFIVRDSVLYAVNVVERLLAAAEILQSSPFLRRVVPEFRREDLRELIVGNYRLVYLVRGDEVIVVRGVHGARDFREVVGPQPWLIP